MEWPRRIITGWSPVDGTVLDPFGGVATVAVAALQTGRHFVCVDADPLGQPTPAKRMATGDEVHVFDFAGGRWIWDTWLAPALVAGP